MERGALQAASSRRPQCSPPRYFGDPSCVPHRRAPRRLRPRGAATVPFGNRVRARRSVGGFKAVQDRPGRTAAGGNLRANRNKARRSGGSRLGRLGVALNHPGADQTRHPGRATLPHRFAKLRAGKSHGLGTFAGSPCKSRAPHSATRANASRRTSRQVRVWPRLRHRSASRARLPRFPANPPPNIPRIVGGLPPVAGGPASPPHSCVAAPARRAAARASRYPCRVSPNRPVGRQHRNPAGAAARVRGRWWPAWRDRACCPERPRAPPRNGGPALRYRLDRAVRQSSSTADRLPVSIRALNASSRRSTSPCQRDGGLL